MTNRTKRYYRKGFTLVELLVVIAIIATLAAISAPAVNNALKKAKRNARATEVRQVGLAILDFASDFEGEFPNDDTAEEFENVSGSGPESYFTQLLENDNLPDEKIFHNARYKDIGLCEEKPNNDGVVDADENGLGYVVGLSSDSSSSLPLVFDSSTQRGTFEKKVWGGYAIVCYTDASCEPVRISGSKKQETGSIKVEKDGTKVDMFGSQFLGDRPEVVVPN